MSQEAALPPPLLAEAVEKGEEEGKKKKANKGTGKASGGKGKGKGKIDGFRLNVKNLPTTDFSTEKLKALFASIGMVVAAEVKFKEDGSSRGFGFVIFANEADSKKAIAEMNDNDVAGRRISVAAVERQEDGNKGKGKGVAGGKRSPARAPAGPFGGGSGYRLNVKNLSGDTTAEKLRELFAPFGTVSDAQVKLKDDGKSRGFGFVIMSSEEEGRRAIAEMDGKEVGRGGGKVAVGPAERRAEEPDEEPKGKGKGLATLSLASAAKPAVAPELAAQQAAYAAYMQHMAYMQQAAMMQTAAMYGANPFAGMGAPPMPQQPPLQVGEYEGSLLSLVAKGHGFIACAETHRLYHCDIYADKAVLPKGAVIGSRLKFTVTANPGEHPKAATATLVS